MRILFKLMLSVGMLFSIVALASEPLVITRQGTVDTPENTLLSIKKAVDSGANAIWLTLQLSKDNEIVLYRPADLQTLTNLKGPVAAYTVAQLHQADAGYWYGKPDYPLRGKNLYVPTLAEVLKRWPNTFFFLEINSPDTPPQLFSVLLEDVLEKSYSYNRVRVYANNALYLDALPDTIARFETEQATQTVLSDIIINHRCDVPSFAIEKWYILKYQRYIQNAPGASPLAWGQEAMRCFRNNKLAKVILTGGNTKTLYQIAQTLHADSVLVDSPLPATR
ncbi:glycerophosphodiester phosphodiesterase family protein [Pseudescherichia sp.]|jgi:glycerophosphoryl diester phosphodiesterase|uniref:glycerophosphodiester phosphodiesterase family protein n=1 Tax=Pseudescherichia sp. TaxID=2055881 RepID=UPI000E92DB61|nr:glycerophosphodiester phosphodiesterase family protein [Pseudescherichia sp.]MDF2778671.1 glycerophosphodiester phosphodiesterase [Enterobacteriaceae bacterium]WPO96254.1 glycerophosphodiester phosphodiesterase family protein [Buttiauxella sp. HR94]HAZ77816.1 glycerophosphodiester phosphodiesterase [Enterobacteriaceae bacterium]